MAQVVTAPPQRSVKPLYAFYRYYVLVILTAVGICSWMDRQLFSILLEPIKHDLLLSDTQLGAVGGIAFGLFYAAVGLPIARLADRINRRNIAAGALLLWSIMTALCGLSTGFASMFLTRMGVGVGEAGSAPASQSIVSDYFEPQSRGFAMGVLYTFVPIGYVLAYATGGSLAITVGWRAAFVLFGAPGILLAILLRMTVREPRRGHSDTHVLTQLSQLTSIDTLRSILRTPSLRHIPLAGALHGLGAFGAAVWVPAYFIRRYSMSTAEIGGSLAILMGTAGLAGALLGGFVSDRLISRTGNPRWYMWLPGASLLLSVPFLLAAFSAKHANTALLLYSVPVLCNHTVLGPIVASMQALAGVYRRATVAAFYLFMVNLISMGFGPLVIGWMSDSFHAAFGIAALQYSLMVLTALTCTWASVHLFLASRTIRADLRAVHALAAPVPSRSNP